MLTPKPRFQPTLEVAHVSAHADDAERATGAPAHPSTEGEGIAIAAIIAADRTAKPPEWVHLLPAGTFRGRDGRGPYTLVDAAEFIQRTKTVHDGAELPIDFGHSLEIELGEAPAAAWISELESRADGIWGRVAWTPSGERAVTAKEYRFLSPVFAHTAGGQALWLKRAGLTNKPNLSLTAVASQRPSTSTTESHVKELLQRLRALFSIPESATDDTIVTRASAALETETAVASMRTKLGLATSATVQDVVTALDERISAHAAATDPTKFVPREQFVAVQTQLAALKTGTVDAAAEAFAKKLLDERKISPAQKGWYVAAHKRDAADAETLAATLVPLVSSGDGTSSATPPPGKDTSLDDTQKSVCAQLGIEPTAFATTRTQTIQ